MEKKQVAFPLSVEEHTNIKALAAKERRTIKQLFLDMLDKCYPNWNEPENKNSPK